MKLSKVLFLIALITLNVLLVSVSSAPMMMRLEKRPKGSVIRVIHALKNVKFFAYVPFFIFFFSL